MVEIRGEDVPEDESQISAKFLILSWESIRQLPLWRKVPDKYVRLKEKTNLEKYDERTSRLQAIIILIGVFVTGLLIGLFI